MLQFISIIAVVLWYTFFAYWQARQMQKEYKELLKKDKAQAEAFREAYLHTYTHFF